MNFSVQYSAFFSGISNVVGASLKNAPVEYLSLVKIVANSSGKCTLECTSMDLTISSTFSCNVIESGTVCTDAYALFEIVKKLRNDIDINCSMTTSKSGAQQLLISSGKSKFLLAVSNSENYPSTLNDAFENSVTVSCAKVAFLVDKTKTCIYPNDTRYNISGILIHSDDANPSKICAISTDGHRLAFASIESEIPSSIPKIIIPKKNISELRKLLDVYKDSDVSIYTLKNKAKFVFTNTTFLTKLVDAEFPAYEKVIPQSNDKILTVDTKDLIKTSERVAAIHASSSDVAVRFDISESNLLISASKSETSSNDELSCTFSGENMFVSCNFSYLKDALSLIESKTVNIATKDSSTPIIIRDSSSQSYFYILMPMRI